MYIRIVYTHTHMYKYIHFRFFDFFIQEFQSQHLTPLHTNAMRAGVYVRCTDIPSLCALHMPPTIWLMADDRWHYLIYADVRIYDDVIIGLILATLALRTNRCLRNTLNAHLAKIPSACNVRQWRMGPKDSVQATRGWIAKHSEPRWRPIQN